MMKYSNDPSKMTGSTIFGRYLSKMKLSQYKDYRWKDTQFLREMQANRIKQSMVEQGYEGAEIERAISRSQQLVPDGREHDWTQEEPEGLDPLAVTAPQEEEPHDYFAEQAETYISTPGYDLTDEDRTYLALKWGKTYKEDEWVQLEKLYNEMMESYDIQTAGHIDTLKLICKTSLKANQLIDLGDKP